MEAEGTLGGVGGKVGGLVAPADGHGFLEVIVGRGQGVGEAARWTGKLPPRRVAAMGGSLGGPPSVHLPPATCYPLPVTYLLPPLLFPLPPTHRSPIPFLYGSIR